MLAGIPQVHLLMVGGPERNDGANRRLPDGDGGGRGRKRLSFPGRKRSTASLLAIADGGKSAGVLQAHMNALKARNKSVAGRPCRAGAEKKRRKNLAMTSSLAGEGKTTVALGLAITWARDYLEETILIIGDIRNPKCRRGWDCRMNVD